MNELRQKVEHLSFSVRCRAPLNTRWGDAGPAMFLCWTGGVSSRQRITYVTWPQRHAREKEAERVGNLPLQKPVRYYTS